MEFKLLCMEFFCKWPFPILSVFRSETHIKLSLNSSSPIMLFKPTPDQGFPLLEEKTGMDDG